MSAKIRAAVIGAGSFGANHIRVLSELPDVELTAVVDVDFDKAQKLAAEHGSKAFRGPERAIGIVDAAIVATPTSTHEAIAAQLLEAGIDVLVEKPITSTSAAAERLARLAEERGRVLQVGHLERFNPAVLALEQAVTIPLFFEIHRLSVFTPRSLDIDVVLDLMIHDLDIVLSFTGEMPVEVRAAGISVLSRQVDIANVRLSFASGCVANLTASRVSTERVRKLRLFQPGEYISLDYQRQDAVRLSVKQMANSERILRNEPISSQAADNASFKPNFGSLDVQRAEPLKLELGSFFQIVRERSKPKVDGFQAANALRVAEAIADKIKEHAELVADTVRAHTRTGS